MYNLLKTYLETSRYTLADAMGRIDYHVARGKITPEEAQELTQLARRRAVEAPDEAMEGRIAALESTLEDLIREEIVPSDKAGQLWRNTYVGDLLAKQEYIPDPNAEGTEGNPIPWVPELGLVPNLFYTYEGVRKVWTGETGVTAEWNDPRWVVF